METAAVRLPFPDGVNFTLMKQLAPDATLVPQVFVSAKSFVSGPVIAMLAMFTVEWLLLLNVIVLARLVVWTG